MVQKPRRSPLPAPAAKVRPLQDIAAAKQATQFPSVGMTLRSYKYDPRDHHKFPAGKGVVVRQGRLARFKQSATWRRVLTFIAIVLVVVGAWVGGKFIYNAHKLFHGNILSVLSTTKLKGEDAGRINILLAGNSSDDPGHDGANLTDSIMLLSIDTKNNRAFLLSIPRDLWVSLGDDGHQKINAAYIDGQSNKFNETGYPAGGMGYLEQVVERSFGVDINYYALVDYSALQDAVNAVGGVDVTIKSSDPRGLYDPSIDYATHGPLVKLSNGLHHLNGLQALDLARARGDNYRAYGFPASDFDRTEHQRQLLVALKTKAESAGVLANPAKLASLSDAIGNNVKTDFNISEVRRLYDLMKKINANNIKSLSLNSADGKNLLMSYTAYGGQSALIPALGLDQYDDIQAFVKRQTSSDTLVQEGATITLLNATSVNGLASKQKTLLTDKNLAISKVGDAATPQAVTTIIDNSGGKKPATRAQLVQLFGSQVTTTNPYSDRYTSDFIVVLGTDRANNTASNSGH